MHPALALATDRPASAADGTYPRPTLVRARHVSLDREVGFAHDDDLVGLSEHWEHATEPFDRTITLPFPPESSASGIADPGFHPCVWYRIDVSADDLERAGHAAGRRLLLHFGAVDYEAMVFVDGTLVAEHTGGQTPFTCDITDALTQDETAAGHVVVVRAFEDPLDTRMPRGKQDWLEEPHVIWYQRTTGIWRTVWLESVPPLHVTRLVWRSDVPRGTVSATIELNRRPTEAVTVSAAIAHQGQRLATVTLDVVDRVNTLTVEIAPQTNGVHYEQLLWSPDKPTLLDAAVIVTGPEGVDEVTSYLGLRDVRVGSDSMELNFRRFYVRSVLEQGYWPTSHLTPPSVEALREEVQLILDLGFNSARIHQKVEDPRFLFWADRLGLTLWCETAAAYTFDSLAVRRLSHDWVDIVRTYEVHPSVIAWVPFNESWGVTHLAHDPAQRAFTRGLTELTRALDPTRPVISNDGWEHTDSDLFTIHDYEWRGEVLAERYTPAGVEKMLATTGPAERPLVLEGPAAETTRRAPVIISEFGGVEFVTEPSADQTWGYSSATDPADFERRVGEIMTAVKGSDVVAGFCWTQLTDTLQEANGLCDENRVPKLPLETLRRLMTR